MSDFIPSKARELMSSLELTEEERELLRRLREIIARLPQANFPGYPTRPVKEFLEHVSGFLQVEKSKALLTSRESAFRKLGTEEELESVASADIQDRHLWTRAEAQRRGENIYGYLARVLRGELTIPMRSSWLQAVNSAGGDESLAFFELDEVVARRNS